MRGFSLIEIITVLGIFAVLLSLSLFMSFEAFRGTLYRSDIAAVTSLLQKARSNSMSNSLQTAWGVCFLDLNYTLFKDGDCSNASAVESIPANPAVAVASDFIHSFPVVVFTQLSGTTSAADIVLYDGTRTENITINNEGAIIW